MTPDTLLAIATFGLVLATAALVGVTLKGIREQLWLMTFAEYTRRYTEIMDDVPFDARRPGAKFDISSLSASAREAFLEAARSYLNLCSEELYLHKRGRLDRKTWQIWEVGIRDTLRCPGFQAAWAVLREEYNFYGDFQTFMDGVSGERNG